MGRKAAAGAIGEGPDRDAAWVARVRETLRAWYDAGHRDFPWRADRDPYRILVSETMLVQTTVAAVAPFFARFLARFPTVRDLAAAPEADVLKSWEGLGYYRRARQLHAAARAIVARHDGRVPSDAGALLALPGVGRYIAGAVMSFAYDLPAPIVEANTQRVLARLLAWRGDLAATATQARLWEAAGRLVPPVGAGAFNQAITELGGTICTPKTPSCLVCPVSPECLARREGLQDLLPIKGAKAPPVAVVEASALIRRPDDGRFLVVRRGPGRLWEGFWEFPTVHVAGADPAGRTPAGEDPPSELSEGFRRLTGVPVELIEPLPTLRFGVTKHRVDLTPYLARPLGDPSSDFGARPGPGLDAVAWESLDSLGALTFGSAQRKLIALARSTV